jgi:hypothetical protein
MEGLNMLAGCAGVGVFGDPPRRFLKWLEILEKPWIETRSILLDEGERGKRLRQSSPFAGCLNPIDIAASKLAAMGKGNPEGLQAGGQRIHPHRFYLKHREGRG